MGHLARVGPKDKTAKGDPNDLHPLDLADRLTACRNPVMIFGDFASKKGEEIEDPYYDGDREFQECYDQVVSYIILRVVELRLTDGRCRWTFRKGS